MNNFFLNEKEIKIEEKYDIKGSLYKRRLEKSRISSGEAMKDENFLENRIKIKLKHSVARKLLNQIQRDAEFLATQKVMDYSMLVGIVDNQKYEAKFKRNDTYFEGEGRLTRRQLAKSSFPQRAKFQPYKLSFARSKPEAGQGKGEVLSLFGLKEAFFFGDH